MESEIELALRRMKNNRREREDYNFSNQVDLSEKENSHPLLRDKTKTRLQRLGVLYGGGEVSSPIHKSEQTWEEEDESPTSGNKSPYAERRAQRFQALAHTINSWEDDIRHISPKKEKEERIDRFGNKVGSKAVRHETVQSPLKTQNGPKTVKGQTPKKVAWDRKIITSLEMQGYKRCESEEHLVYDYVSPESKQCLSPSRRRPPQQNASSMKKELTPSPKKTLDFPREHSPTPRRNVEFNREQSPSPRRNVEFNREQSPSPRRNVEFNREQSLSPRRNIESHREQSLSPRRNIEFHREQSPSPKKNEAFIRQTPSPKKVDCLSSFNRERSASPQKLPSEVLLRTTTPKEPIMSSKPATARALNTQFRERSPQRSKVLELAAQYDSESPSPKAVNSAVDPALLSVAEKKAVFERNRGAAPPMPQQLPRPRAVSPPKPRPLRAAPLLDSRPESSPVKDSVKQAMIERFQELEALRHRWDKNKMLASLQNNKHGVEEYDEEEEEEEMEESEEVTEAPIPMPPPLPSTSYRLSSPSSSRKASLSPTPSPPQIKMGVSSPVGRRSPARHLPRILSVKEKIPSHHRDVGLHYPEVKKIKVSPPKPGRLYPSISDIETESEVPETDLDTIDEEYMDEEEEQMDTSNLDSSGLETTDGSCSSFGKEIVRQASKTNLKRPSYSLEESSSSSANESKILREMDNLLDEALGSPSPKRARDSQKLDYSISESCSTNSFEFSEAEHCVTTNQPKEEKEVKTPLIHSISLYRRQQNNKPTLTPIRKEIRREVVVLEDEKANDNNSPAMEEEAVQAKIHELTIEMQRQIETVSQASKALNMCLSTPGFAGTAAEVEAQKLLLVASSRWTSLKTEIERLRIEKRLKSGGGNMLDRGDITVQSISVPLKASYAAPRDQSLAHVICLLRTGCVVLQTEVLAIDKNAIRNGRLLFQKVLSLVDLYCDFTVSVEVYGYTVQRQPDIIADHKGKATPSKKEKQKAVAAKKLKDKFPPIESPAGPNAVRSSAFQLWGFAVFSLREVNRTSFSLSKVPYTCPLEGSIEISMNSSMQSQVEHSGFLTVYEDVSGFGAWKRRWCQLKGSSLAFWTYPEHCREGKVAVDTIDLSTVSTVEASLAPRDVCARPHTILLESQLRGSSLQESLVVRKRGDITVVMHLLSADTKEERLAWCKQINKVLHLLRAWKVNCATAV